ncbi:hypothetical protein TNCV_962501 [Trichonephila clavipes]|nr:hypothetical protein TNCV_962501 [Trichonephila clavipes]
MAKNKEKKKDEEEGRFGGVKEKMSDMKDSMEEMSSPGAFLKHKQPALFSRSTSARPDYNTTTSIVCYLVVQATWLFYQKVYPPLAQTVMHMHQQEILTIPGRHADVPECFLLQPRQSHICAFDLERLKISILFGNIPAGFESRRLEPMTRRKGLRPEEFFNSLRELSENESDGGELSCSNLDSEEDIRLKESDCK